MKAFNVGESVFVPHLDRTARVLEVIHVGREELSGARPVWGYRLEGIEEPVEKKYCETPGAAT
ncbi:hypothetical protein [Microbaculum marinum]|uniref:Uncharacterized protein n=1 Tax=Microbaculum marinum TaxID=1764581 RepID=A0AAW9RLR1_9HYPH